MRKGLEKMHTKKGYFQNPFKVLKKYPIHFLICTLVIVIFIILYFESSNSGISVYGRLFSLADCYVWIMKPIAFGFVILPVTLFLSIFITEEDLNILNVLWYSTKKNIFLNQILKIGYLSCFISLISMISTGITGMFMVEKTINWNCASSVFCILTKRTIENISIWKVMGVFFITSWVRLFLFCTAANCFLWIYRQKSIPFIAMLVITCSEIVKPKYPLFFLSLSMDYRVWGCMKRIIQYVSYVSISSIILFMIAKLAIQRKEFMDEK